MNTEAEITINGHRLDEGQSMAVRVALMTYLSEIRTDGALGDDAIGEHIRQGYEARLVEVVRLWLKEVK